MNSSQSILEFENYREYLAALQKAYPGKKRPLTLAQFAKILGYSSPRTVAMVLKGQRPASAEMIHKLSQAIRMSEKERVYFDLLVKREQELKKNKTALAIENELQKLKRKFYADKKLDQDVYRMVSDWYHYPIWFLVNKGKSPDQIQAMLRSQLSLDEINEAIQRLTDLGLIGKDGWQPQQDVPSQAIRSHHAQMMDQAERALKNDLISDREFANTTLSFPVERMAEAKKMIRDFVAEFQNRFHNDDIEEIMQLGVYLFQHTKKN